jgi:arylsulfatase
MPIYTDSGFFERIADYLRKGGDPKKFKESGIRPDLSKRGFVRTVFDGRYKYSRYFSPREHNQPKTLQEILKYNTIELFDLKADPDELLNLGAEPEKHRELILRMNAMLNNLIRREIGEDNGQYLPGEGPWAIRYMHY